MQTPRAALIALSALAMGIPAGARAADYNGYPDASQTMPVNPSAPSGIPGIQPPPTSAVPASQNPEQNSTNGRKKHRPASDNSSAPMTTLPGSDPGTAPRQPGADDSSLN